MSIITISSEQDFNEQVAASAVPVLVDFWAPWCGPCKMIAPELEIVAEEYAGKAAVAKINVDENQKLANRFNVMSIPTLLIMKNGEEVERVVGFRPSKALMELLDKTL